MGQWWYDIDMRKRKYSEENMFWYLIAHHTTHKDWPGIELGLSW